MVELLALGDTSIIITTLVLFFVAALMEIIGGYLVWQWIREKKGILIGLTGGIILSVYGIIPTLQTISFWENICCIWWDIHYFVNHMGNDCR
jgi:hypothetical protein